MSIHFVEPNGITVHKLESGTTMVQAAAFFNKMGFAITGRRVQLQSGPAFFLACASAQPFTPTNTKTTH